MVSVTRPAHWPRWVRFAVTALAVLVVLGATVVVGYRVLSPAETSVPASRPYPERPAATSTRYGELTSAPLIVDGRLRVYADPRRVWADAPLTRSTETTPFWAYRRWPAEVAGVVAVEGRFEGVAMVIVKFSDGVVVALNARTGGVAWQDQARAGDRDRFRGRRTGALTVYRPEGLFTARSSVNGAAVLVVAGADQAIGYDPWTGERRWEQVFTEHPGCHDMDWTGETTYVVKDACAAPAVLRIFDAGTGRLIGRWQPPGASPGPAEAANWFVEPVSCMRGYSGCGLLRASPGATVITAAQAYGKVPGAVATAWRLNYDGTVTAEPCAVADRPFLLGETLVQEEIDGNGIVQAVERTPNQPDCRNKTVLWRSKVRVKRVIAVGLLGVHAVTADNYVVVLHPTSGIELGRTDLRKRATERWEVGQAYVAGRFVVIERVTRIAAWDEPDDRYYVGPTPVVLAGV
jgi:outer membrane protein assembly factor BamB